MKNYNVQLTEEDLNKIIGCIDIAVKQIGLNAGDLILLASKIDSQVKEQKMEINIDHSIPLWGLIGAICGGIYFIMQIQSRIILMDRRIQTTENALEKIEEKFTIIDSDIKVLTKEVMKLTARNND